MHTMDKAEWLEFVHTGTRTGKVATIRADGSPHVAPIWFVVATGDDTDTDRVIFMTGADTVKGKALRRDPRFALCVDLEQEPFAYVQFQAVAEISEDPAELLHWSTIIARRYMGEERAEEFGKRNAVPGELLVYGRISKVIALGDISD